MDERPAKGQRVRWADPWFYDGEGIVLAHQLTPTACTQVMILEIDDPANQHWVGRTTWILTGWLKDPLPGAANTRPGADPTG